MAHGNSLFAFVAGALAGAALLYLAKSEKGEKFVEDVREKGSELFNDGRAAVLSRLDKVEEVLKEKKQTKSRKETQE